MEEFTYRRAEMADMELFLTFYEAMLRDEGWGDDMTSFFMKKEPARTRRLMGDGTRVPYLAYSGRSAVGMGVLYDWATVDGLEGDSTISTIFYTVPDFRGRGIMHRLVELLIEETRRRGCRRVKIRVDDEKYRSAYHKLGFRDIYDYLEDEHFCPVWGLSDEMELILRHDEPAIQEEGRSW